MGSIRTTFEIVTLESAEDGDAAERGWKDEEGTEYSVEEAIELIKGCEPSSSHFHSGIWYTSYGDMNPRNGETENISYHLAASAWTEVEERAIFDGRN